MAPFSIPAPCIVPLGIPVCGGKKHITTLTKIEFMCETFFKLEIFYTLDGTKPQPYSGIVQGSKAFKYKNPITLPAGKVTIKAIALNARARSMKSSIVTKCYDVLKAESESSLKKSLNRLKKKKNMKNKQSELSVEAKLTVNANGNVDSDAAVNLGSPCAKDICLDEQSASTEDGPIQSEVEYLNELDSENQSEDNSNLEQDIESNQSEMDSIKQESQSSLIKSTATDNGTLVSNMVHCEVENKSTAVSGPCSFCTNPDATLEQYNRLCANSSKFCIQCGKKLLQVCLHCKKLNSLVAAYCQFCGSKLEMDDNKENLNFNVDRSVMAKPERSHASVQLTPNICDKQTQTLYSQGESAPKGLMKKSPAHSPGKGYWHQQLDYICNHLKSYAYNNNEFRSSISEPILNQFQSAKVMTEEKNVSITLVFSTLVLDENKNTS